MVIAFSKRPSTEEAIVEERLPVSGQIRGAVGNSVRIIEDKAALNVTYKGSRAKNQINNREIIGRVQGIWFEFLHINDYKDGSVHSLYLLSRKGQEELRRVK